MKIKEILRRIIMGFTSVIFLFLFVPVSIILYYLMIMLEKIRILKKMRIRDIVLVLISIFFYGWAGLDGVKFISVYVVGVFITGKLIGLVKKKKYIKYGIEFPEAIDKIEKQEDIENL